MTELQTREAILRIGDWSDDGHGKHVEARVRMTGVDVSNESLAAARKRAEEALGFELESICQEYEESSIGVDELTKLIELEFPIFTPPDAIESDIIVWLRDGDGEWAIEQAEEDGFVVSDEVRQALKKEGIDAVRLIMAFLGYGVEQFSYELVPADIIVGGHGAPGGSFGYGLFY